MTIAEGSQDHLLVAFKYRRENTETQVLFATAPLGGDTGEFGTPLVLFDEPLVDFGRECRTWRSLPRSRVWAVPGNGLSRPYVLSSSSSDVLSRAARNSSKLMASRNRCSMCPSGMEKAWSAIDLVDLLSRPLGEKADERGFTDLARASDEQRFTGRGGEPEFQSFHGIARLFSAS